MSVITVEQYHKMAEAGILEDGDPVELLEGLLVRKALKNRPRILATRFTWAAFERLAPVGWFVDAQDPITTAESEPEPDVSVARGEPLQFLDHHPGPKDLALVVEVSDTSLQHDRTMKLRIYARAEIAVYWIVNLIEGHIEVYTEPSGPAEQPTYRQRRDYGLADEVPFVLDGREVGRVAVRELLPWIMPTEVSQ